MLTVLVQPILKFMNILHTIAIVILKGSYYIGRTIVVGFIQACNIVRDVCIALAIIGEEFYHFLGELNSSIAAVSTYVRTSANGGINCVLEAVGIFIKHIAIFFSNTRLFSKLFATHLGSAIGDVLILLRNALLLIADCVFWLPKCFFYAVISTGDFIIESITAVRITLMLITQVILEDVFRLSIAIVLIIFSWHNRRRLASIILRWSLKVKQLLRLCWISIIKIARVIFRRFNPIITIPIQTEPNQMRSTLTSTDVSASNKNLDHIQRCVICTDREKCVLLLPCKHLCLCEVCFEYMFSSAQNGNCPLCRSVVNQSISVYI